MVEDGRLLSASCSQFNSAPRCFFETCPDLSDLSRLALRPLHSLASPLLGATLDGARAGASPQPRCAAAVPRRSSACPRWSGPTGASAGRDQPVPSGWARCGSHPG
ncbi:unnamed protein product, partial [Prorocentrum cordatum]